MATLQTSILGIKFENPFLLSSAPPTASIKSIDQAIELGLKRVRFVSDNLMMVNQMNGIYRVKNRDIIPIYNDVKELLKNFEAAAFVHVKRELNTKADLEVNIAINRHFGIDSDKGMHSEE